jgi:carbon-monoxide dehydrogenase large subunit
VLDGGDYPAALRRAAELLGDADPTPDDGRAIGVGVACYVEGTGIGPFESARVDVGRDGRVRLRTGACSQGQGHATVFAQILADALGVDPAAIDVVGGDTDGLAQGWGTVASRSLVLAGNATAEAGGEVRAQVLQEAERLLEIPAADLTIEAGRVVPRGAPARAVGLDAVAAAAEAGGRRLDAYRLHEPPTVTWSYGAHAVRVAVDLATGVVEILRYVAVHDCGRVVNPTIVDGQVRGGLAQGIGGALYEEILYDEDAQLKTGTLADYLLPTADVMPPIVLDHTETPTERNPLGVRGVGEGGAIAPAAAVANAVEDALGAVAVVRRTPLEPAAVRALVAAARAAGALV